MRTITHSAFALLAVVALASLPLEGCSSDETETAATTGVGAGTNTGAGTSTGGGDTGGGATGGTGGTGAGTSTGGSGGLPLPTEQVQCGNQLYECGDLIDNDSDGLLDYQDPDCLGPCDNTEDSFYPDLPGASGQKCDLDCFWDTGQGHEESCYWHHECDPHANDQDPLYDGVANPQSMCMFSGTAAEQSAHTPGNSMGKSCDEMYNMQDQECLDDCHPMAPNGCDCFGCCELGGQYVYVGSTDENGLGTCEIGDIGQANFTEDCHPCVPVPGCNNPCEVCELCIGKTTLPPECFPGEGGGGAGQGGSGGAPQDCPEGQQACGLPSQPSCPSGQYCITGCCVIVPD